MFSSNELITNTSRCTESILQKWKATKRVITPIGMDCYSSFLAKEIKSKNYNYVPSLFGFRNIDINFFCNYMEKMNIDKPWILPNQDMIDTRYDLQNRIHIFEHNPDLHQLNNTLGLFILNHDGGKHARPYNKEILNKEVTDRLAFLELITHILFYKMTEVEHVILVASGPIALKEKIVNTFNNNSNKFEREFSLLFINCPPPKPGSKPPTVSYANGGLEFSLYKEHTFYGNVAQNWTSLNKKTILLAQEIIENDLALRLTI